MEKGSTWGLHKNIYCHATTTLHPNVGVTNNLCVHVWLYLTTGGCIQNVLVYFVAWHKSTCFPWPIIVLDFIVCSWYWIHSFFRDGEAWSKQRSALAKLIMPANFYSYTPGFNRATSYLMTNLLASRNDQGYVEDAVPHLTHWGAECKKELMFWFLV